MQFGLMFFAADENALTGDRYRLVIESARFADARGFSSVWVPERHFAQLGCLYPNPAVLHAALARETERIRLLAGSVVAPLHHPLRIAEEWSMVDNLSGGRVGISLAPGWNPDDFALFPDLYDRRYEELPQRLETVRRLWRGEALEVINGKGETAKVRIYPTPVQPELPLWVTAARSPSSFARAGELGAHLLTHLLDHEIDELAGKIALYRQSRAEHGHDPESGQVSLMLHTFVGEDVEEVREAAREPYCNYLKSNIGQLKGLAQSRGLEIDVGSLPPEELDGFVGFLYERFYSTRALIGSPESCLDLVKKLFAAGVDEVACLLDFGPSSDVVLAHLPHLERLKERAQAELSEARREAPAEAVPAKVAASTNDRPSAAAQVAELLASSLDEVRARAVEELSGEAYYDHVAGSGAVYGPTMRSLERLWRNDREVLAELRLPAELQGELSGYQFHPVLLDNCFLVLGALAEARLERAGEALALPTGVRRLVVHRQPGARVWSHAVALVEEGAPADRLEGDVRILDEAGELVAEAQGLRIELLEKPARRELPATDLLYQLSWVAQPLEGGGEEEGASLPGEPRGSWLLLGDGRGVAPVLAALLAARGERVVQLSALQMTSSEALHRALEGELSAEPPCRGILHLASLDEEAGAETTVEGLERAERSGVQAVLEVVKGLAAGVPGTSPRLWVVTRGAQPVTGKRVTAEPMTAEPVMAEPAPTAVAAGPLWGFGRVVGAEHPDLWGGLVDLDPEAHPEDSAAALLEEISRPDGEQQIGYRQGLRYAARLERAREWAQAPRGVSFRPDAGYLLTGGLGDLGLAVAQWMVERGARHLLLLGRTPLPARESWDALEPGSRAQLQVAGVRRLEAEGARVYTAAADVACAEELDAALAAFREAGAPPVRGVIHTAGIAQGSTVGNLTPESLSEVLRPKVTGTWLLHERFSGDEVELFALFSAVPALVGWIGAGAANYSAANAFLDIFAHYRRGCGLPALAISWGPWSRIGVAAREPGGLEQLAAVGIGSYSPETALELFDRMLGHGGAQVAVASLDWPRFFRAFPAAARSPQMSVLVEEAGSQMSVDLEARAAVMEAPAEERPQLLESYLRRRVAHALAIPAGRLEADRSLLELGLDSLMSIDLRNRIESELEVSIPMVTLLQGPSIRQLVGEVLPSLPPPMEELAPLEEGMEEITL